jgi:chaperonin GroES
MANIQPLHDNVLLKPAALEEKTASGILLPDSAKEKTKQGEVIAVGPGKIDNGQTLPMQVKIGDKVLYSWGEEIKIDGTEYILVSEGNIQAIIS